MSRSFLVVRASLAALTSGCFAPPVLATTIVFESAPQSSVEDTWSEGVGYYGTRDEFVAVRFTIAEPTIVTGVEGNLYFDNEYGDNPVLFAGIEELGSASSFPRYDPLLGTSVFLAYSEVAFRRVWDLQTVLDPGVYALVVGCAQPGCLMWIDVAEGELFIPPEDFLWHNSVTSNWNVSSVQFRLALLGVPEPATGGMLLMGVLTLSLRRRRCRRSGPLRRHVRSVLGAQLRRGSALTIAARAARGFE